MKMKSKILLFLTLGIFAIFLTSGVSAIVAYGDWEDGSQDAQIIFGENIDFNADFFSMSPPMKINVKLYDSQDNLLHSFENDLSVSENSFAETYTLTQSEYQSTGNFNLVLSGSDDFPDTDSYSLMLTVSSGANNAPTITSTPVTSVDENTQYSYDVDATDSDGDALTYSLSQASPNWLSIDSSTGLITGTAPEVSSNTNFDVSIEVSDGADTDTQTYTLTVNDVSQPNSAPTITSTPITEVNESSNYFYDVDATDSDGDSLTYSLTQAPNWLSIDSSTGLVSGTAPSVSQDTDYDVTVEVSDGTDTDTQTYALTVNDVPEPNNAPVANDMSVTTKESTSINITLSSSDADGDSLTHVIVDSPSNGTISNFDSSTGGLTYTPNTGFFGSDSFTFKANDGDEDSNVATVTINVEENNGPLITSTPETEVNETENYVYDVDASDTDGDSLTYSLTQAPNWLSINSSTGLINVTAPVVTNDSKYTIEISVSDGVDSTTQSYVLTVLNIPVPNSVPVITSTPGTRVDEGSLYQYQISATDADNDTLTYLLTEAPGWLSINSSTGLVSGVAPSVSSEVENNITIMISDGKDVGMQTYVLTIDNIPSDDGDGDGDDGGDFTTNFGKLGSGTSGAYNETIGGPIFLDGESGEKTTYSLFEIISIFLIILIILLIISIILAYLRR